MASETGHGKTEDKQYGRCQRGQSDMPFRKRTETRRTHSKEEDVQTECEPRLRHSASNRLHDMRNEQTECIAETDA